MTVVEVSGGGGGVGPETPPVVSSTNAVISDAIEERDHDAKGIQTTRISRIGFGF